MKSPTSKGDGTTGAWKAFSNAYNRVGDKAAEKRRKHYDELKKIKKSSFRKSR